MGSRVICALPYCSRLVLIIEWFDVFCVECGRAHKKGSHVCFCGSSCTKRIPTIIQYVLFVWLLAFAVLVANTNKLCVSLFFPLNAWCVGGWWGGGWGGMGGRNQRLPFLCVPPSFPLFSLLPWSSRAAPFFFFDVPALTCSAELLRCAAC